MNVLLKCWSNFTAKAFLVAALQFVANVCSSESQLPPSNPGAAIDLGTIDYPSDVGGNQKGFLCKRYRVDLTWNNQNFNTSYFKFRVANPNSRIVMQMTENPPQSMYYILYDGSLNLIKKIEGAVNEEINELFSAGNYYVQVLTDPSDAHLPDNKNIGDILVRAYPPLHPFAQSPQPSIIDLGQLNSSIEQTGVLEAVTGRKTNFSGTLAGEICPP